MPNFIAEVYFTDLYVDLQKLKILSCKNSNILLSQQKFGITHLWKLNIFNP